MQKTEHFHYRILCNKKKFTEASKFVFLQRMITVARLRENNRSEFCCEEFDYDFRLANIRSISASSFSACRRFAVAVETGTRGAFAI